MFKKVFKNLFSPIYCLLIRPLSSRNIRDFYYSVFKMKSFKLFICNDFSIKNEEGVRIQYFYRKKVDFPHPIGIVIGGGARLGMNCQIYQNVTIGKGHGGYPTLGDNVTIFAGSTLFNNITVGNNVIIGANTLVNMDVPDNATVYGNPAVIKLNK
ncbi:hypothetical protein GCM10007916_36900 [Psychromonas marina]|uniref:Serine acetyltransferase n=1 Tax=Psychromonas marina TaxID=88364 RepID=A0ABQ6E620_9GAMM|nr:serine acetyltransferase [Psychromonas marina]GLS92618.1 hypothetical protein GCM10007916_36900 [Psychromonas marina]